MQLLPYTLIKHLLLIFKLNRITKKKTDIFLELHSCLSFLSAIFNVRAQKDRFLVPFRFFSQFHTSSIPEVYLRRNGQVSLRVTGQRNTGTWNNGGAVDHQGITAHGTQVEQQNTVGTQEQCYVMLCYVFLVWFGLK